MRHVRAIYVVTLGAALASTAGCYPPMPTPNQYFEASFPAPEPKTDWRRVDPELRAAGIRLHVDVDGGPGDGSLDEVHRSLDSMATALDRLPAGSEAPRVAAAARRVRERARLLEGGIPDEEKRRAVVKDALSTTVWAMMALTGYAYALDPGVGERVARFRDRVDAIDASRLGLGQFDVYEALAGGRDALDGFLFAIANGRVR